MNNKKSGRTVTVLGSTGSVGRQTLDVLRKSGIRVEALSASSNIELLEAQIREFRPSLCAVKDEVAAKKLRKNISDMPCEVIFGNNAASEAARYGDADIVFNSTSGVAGLLPTLSAIEAGRDVALANKETLVAAGELVMSCALEHGVNILPVDSEHCAVFQCINGSRNGTCGVSRIILTASGGPFRGYTSEKLKRVTLSDALSHPTWKMGKKITVDCATLMNKGLEVIEAARLYSMPWNKIDVVIHPESIVHSMVEYNDNAVLAQLAVPDMRLCIAYALNYPERGGAIVEKLDLTKIGRLTFENPDTEKFPLLALAYDALKAGGTAPAVLNAANEVAVELFLNGKIEFSEISNYVTNVLEHSNISSDISLESILEADRAVREMQ